MNDRKNEVEIFSSAENDCFLLCFWHKAQLMSMALSWHSKASTGKSCNLFFVVNNKKTELMDHDAKIKLPKF